MICAQRLSASEIRHLFVDENPVDNVIRAQRLSASEIRHLTKFGFILNYIRVLNAFRHQRFDTELITRISLKDRACSTPFGIRDSTRLALLAIFLLVVSAQRLSASEIRHLVIAVDL